MKNKEVKEKLDKVAKELFPDLKLIFGANDYFQLNVFISHIRIESSVSIDRGEIVHNDIFNELKTKNILKGRAKMALTGLKDLVQNSLDKLEKL